MNAINRRLQLPEKPFMKTGLLFLLLGMVPLVAAFGQMETDIYLADLKIQQNGIQLATPVNISKNPGYDNQPSFLDGETLLYSRNRGGQTDIARYSLKEGTTSWLSDTPGGSEYSPLKIPGREAVSSIRLDTTGLQRLYAYPLGGGEPNLLVKGLKIGYHLWADPDLLVCTVLVEDRMDLVVVNLKEDSRHTFQKDVGRSLLRVPGSERISYLEKEQDTLVVKSMDPRSGANERIIALPEGVQDLVWLPDGTLLCGYGNKLLGFQPGRDPDWRILQVLPPEAGRITRLAVSPDGSKLALTLGPDPQVPVDHQIYAFNTKDLEAFVQAFSDSVVGRDFDFPEPPLFIGRECLKQDMDLRFVIRKEARYEIVHRTILGNKVIDEVRLSVFNGYERFVAIYEVEKGLITRITYIHRKIQKDP